MKVLLADDHAATRNLIADLVRGVGGCELCGEAYDGEQAVRLAASLLPDVIVMDHSMPGLSGLAAARLIKALRPGVRILILSMHDVGEFGRAAEAAGIEAWMTKSDALAGGLRSVLSGSPAGVPLAAAIPS